MEAGQWTILLADDADSADAEILGGSNHGAVRDIRYIVAPSLSLRGTGSDLKASFLPLRFVGW
jgi:hypothetical protein